MNNTRRKQIQMLEAIGNILSPLDRAIDNIHGSINFLLDVIE